jgi:YD repeat-containing protein
MLFTFVRRSARPSACALALFVAAAFFARPAQAVDPQYQCTAPGVTPGSFCTSVYPTPWVYHPEINIEGTKNYASLGEIIAAWEAYLPAHTVRCAPTPLTSTTFDVSGPWSSTSPHYEYGVDIFHQHRLKFLSIVYNNSAPMCGITWADYSTTILVTRSVVCPVGYTLIYEAGPPVVGPYCALEWDKVDEHKCPGGCGSGQVHKGNPGEVASGNKRQIETDYTGVLPFERRYNGLTAKTSHWRWPALGKGWTADYFQRVDRAAHGGFDTAYVFRGDGRTLAFNASGTAFVAPVDVNISLTAQRDGSGNITGWTLEAENDDTEVYDGEGRLLSITTRSGRVRTLQYDPVSLLLQSVTDSHGNQLLFEFDAKRRLTKLTNPAGQFIQYAYNSYDNLLSATYPTPRVGSTTTHRAPRGI